MLALLAAACIDVEMDLEVREDGSGSVAATMRLDTAVLGIAALGEDETPEELCRQMADETGADGPGIFGLSDLDGGVDASLEDGGCAIRFGRTWTAAESETVLADLARNDGPTIRRIDGGGWRFELNMDPISDEFSGDDLAQAAALGFDFPTLAISVMLPGDAVEHNADSLRQSTYSWHIDVAAGDELPESLYAETAPSGGGLGPEAIGAIVAATALALAALVTLRRHQRAKSAATRQDENGSATEPPAEA